MELLKAFSDTFWSTRVWLPPNTTWADIAPGSRPDVKHADYKDLIWPLPLALVLIVLRYLVETYWIGPIGKSIGIKSTRSKRAAPNETLEAAYNANNRLRHITETISVCNYSFEVHLYITMNAGPDTSTHKELAAVLPSIQTIIQARELYGKIFGSLLEKSPNYELKIGTKIYVDQSINPRQRYAAIMESYYFTKVEKLEFAKSAESAKIINDWCANITQNLIKELVKSEDVEESIIIMLNALYFNGYWRRPFPINETVQLPFYVSPTTQVKTSFMAVTDTFYYMESQPLNAKILRLPYKGRKFSMTIVLPNAKGGLDEMIRQMESSTLHRAQ